MFEGVIVGVVGSKVVLRRCSRGGDCGCYGIHGGSRCREGTKPQRFKDFEVRCSKEVSKIPNTDLLYVATYSK